MRGGLVPRGDVGDAGVPGGVGVGGGGGAGGRWRSRTSSSTPGETRRPGGRGATTGGASCSSRDAGPGAGTGRTEGLGRWVRRNCRHRGVDLPVLRADWGSGVRNTAVWAPIGPPSPLGTVPGARGRVAGRTRATGACSANRDLETPRPGSSCTD